MQLHTRKDILEYKELYPAGTRISLEYMNDRNAPPVGTVGTVRRVDEMGELVVSWDNGSGMMVIPNVDKFTVVETPKKRGRKKKVI